MLGVNSAAVAALALISLAPVGHAQAAGADSAMIVGRVTFRDSVHQAKADDVERLRRGRLVVEMRRGWDVYSANPDGNGFFSISGPPGTYRLDYVRVGQLSEFGITGCWTAKRGRSSTLSGSGAKVGPMAASCCGDNAGPQNESGPRAAA